VIRKQGSKVEERLLQALLQGGHKGWRQGVKAPGSPDLALTDCTPPVAVFVDGCFWHKCPQHFKLPVRKRGFWRVKLDRNAIRDRGVGWPCTNCGEPTGILVEQGWIVVRVWEHEVKADPDAAAARVMLEIGRQRGRWDQGLRTTP
jgi:DNA mismatch endonuclease (patch repair protein)